MAVPSIGVTLGFCSQTLLRKVAGAEQISFLGKGKLAKNARLVVGLYVQT